MSKLLLQKDFMNIWDLKSIKEQNLTNKEIRIHYCI